MKKIICEVYIDEDMLKEFYCEKEGCSEEDYCFVEAFNSEFGWLDESGIFLGDWRVVIDEPCSAYWEDSGKV